MVPADLLTVLPMWTVPLNVLCARTLSGPRLLWITRMTCCLASRVTTWWWSLIVGTVVPFDSVTFSVLVTSVTASVAFTAPYDFVSWSTVVLVLRKLVRSTLLVPIVLENPYRRAFDLTCLFWN